MNGQKDKKRLAAKKQKGYMAEVIQGRNKIIPSDSADSLSFSL